MRYSPRFLDDIRERVPLADIVGRRVKLTRRGREYVGLCPFHNEKTPSFTVADEKGFYHCFGCGAHGDVFGFVEQTDGLSFPEAVEHLAEQAGVELPKPDPEAEKTAARRAGLHEVTEAACRWFEAELGKSDGQAARSYLDQRGLDRRTILDFRLGFAPPGRQGLKDALSARGISVDSMLEAGLLVRPDDGGPAYDRFRNRIVFPITDRRGRVIAFGGRAMDADARAKYLNSPETPLFHKGATLYNLAAAKKAAYDAGTVIAVEGYMDVIALSEAGIAHTVAPLGTALTEDQIQALWRLAPEPVLCFDGDVAGARAASRAIARALPILRPGYSIRFALLPDGLDPDDLVRREGKAGMQRLIEAAEPLADMLWKELTGSARLDTPERRAGLERDVFKRLTAISDDSLRRFYQRDFKDRLWRLMSQRQSRSSSPQSKRSWQGRSGGSGFPGTTRPSGLRRTRLGRDLGSEAVSANLEELILLCVINHPELLRSRDEAIASIEFSDPMLDKLRDRIIATVSSSEGLDRSALKDHLAGIGFQETVAMLEKSAALKVDWFAQADAALSDAEQGLDHVMARLRKMRFLHSELKAAEKAFAEDMTDETLERIRALHQEIQTAQGDEANLDGYGVASGRSTSY